MNLWRQISSGLVTLSPRGGHPRLVLVHRLLTSFTSNREFVLDDVGNHDPWAYFTSVSVGCCSGSTPPSLHLPGDGQRSGRPRQQSAALLHSERRCPAAVLHSPSQRRDHRPHLAGQRGGRPASAFAVIQNARLEEEKKKGPIDHLRLLRRCLTTL